MHKRTAHNDTEPIEEEQEAYFEPPAGQCIERRPFTDGQQCGMTTVLGCVNRRSDAIDDPNVSYSTAVLEADDSGSEQVPVESSDVVGQQHVAVVTQEDGTQQQVMKSPL